MKCIVLAFLVVSALATGGVAAADKTRGAPDAVCERAAAPRYILDPADADACWIVLDAAIQAGNYDRARRAATLGCEKHRRTDFCAFLSNLQALSSASSFIRARSSQSTSYYLAMDLVTPIDVDDAEDALYRELNRRRKAK